VKPLKPLVKPFKRKPMLIALSAVWCGPCQLAKPTVNKIEEAGFHVTRYNIDTPAGREAMQKYNVTAVPTFIIVEPDGKERDGTHDVNEVRDYFNTFLPDSKKVA